MLIYCTKSLILSIKINLLDVFISVKIMQHINNDTSTKSLILISPIVCLFLKSDLLLDIAPFLLLLMYME